MKTLPEFDRSFQTTPFNWLFLKIDGFTEGGKKYVHLYLSQNQHTNIAGIWNKGQIRFPSYTPPPEIIDLLQSLVEFALGFDRHTSIAFSRHGWIVANHHECLDAHVSPNATLSIDWARDLPPPVFDCHSNHQTMMFEVYKEALHALAKNCPDPELALEIQEIIEQEICLGIHPVSDGALLLKYAPNKAIIGVLAGMKQYNTSIIKATSITQL